MIINYKDIIIRKQNKIKVTKDKNSLEKLFQQIDKLFEWNDNEILNKQEEVSS